MINSTSEQEQQNQLAASLQSDQPGNTFSTLDVQDAYHPCSPTPVIPSSQQVWPFSKHGQTPVKTPHSPPLKPRVNLRSNRRRKPSPIPEEEVSPVNLNTAFDQLGAEVSPISNHNGHNASWSNISVGKNLGTTEQEELRGELQNLKQRIGTQEDKGDALAGQVGTLRGEVHQLHQQVLNWEDQSELVQTVTLLGAAVKLTSEQHDQVKQALDDQGDALSHWKTQLDTKYNRVNKLLEDAHQFRTENETVINRINEHVQVQTSRHQETQERVNRAAQAAHQVALFQGQNTNNLATLLQRVNEIDQGNRETQQQVRETRAVTEHEFHELVVSVHTKLNAQAKRISTTTTLQFSTVLAVLSVIFCYLLK